MSRIGKKPILIPKDVEIKIEDGKVKVKGNKGELYLKVRPEINIEVKEGKLYVFPFCLNSKKQTKGIRDLKKVKSFWGLTRSLIFNMVKGVTEGFEKKLKIEGVGYRASIEGEDLVLEVGFTHPVKIKIPSDIKVSMEKDVINISGIDKAKVSQFAAKIRAVRPPEPYKGKGIRYLDEIVRRKEKKKAEATA